MENQPTNGPVPVTENNVAAQQPTTPETPQTPQTPREELYSKYSRLYDSPSQSTTPSPNEPTSEPSAQDGPQPQQAEGSPAPDTEGLSPTPNVTPERLEAVEQQLSQIVNILAQLAAPPEQQPQQAQPVAVEDVPGDWIEFLKQGKIAEAEEALANRIAKKFSPKIKQEATQDSLDAFRVEQDLGNFITDLRRKNPDLVPLEDVVAAKAKVRLEAAQASGKIRSADEYIAAYKDAVNKAADEARKIVSTIRATSRDEATVRNREVISTTPVAPNPISPDRGNPPQKPQLQEESPESYISRRRANVSRTTGFNSQ